MKFLDEFFERRAAKHLTDRETYSALVRKLSGNGDLAPDDRKRFYNVAETLRISDDQIRDDVRTIAEHTRLSAETANAAGVKTELADIGAEVAKLEGEYAEMRINFQGRFKVLEDRREAVDKRLNQIQGCAQRIEQLTNDNPTLFAKPAEVAELAAN